MLFAYLLHFELRFTFAFQAQAFSQKIFKFIIAQIHFFSIIKMQYHSFFCRELIRRDTKYLDIQKRVSLISFAIWDINQEYYAR